MGSADILARFLDGETPAKETIEMLHGMYEEYAMPDYLTAFEMIYYDHCAPGADQGVGNLHDRLQAEARNWLSETTNSH